MSHEEITAAVERYNELLEQAKQEEENENYAAALDTINRAESAINKYASKSEVGNIHYLKGKLKMSMGDYKKSEEFLKKALTISKETKGAIDDSRITFSLGDLYYLQSDIEMSLKYYLEAISIINNEYERITYSRKHLENEIIEEMIKQNLRLSEVYFQINELEKSIKHGRIAIELGDKSKEEFTILQTQHKLAKIEMKLGNYKSAFNKLIDIRENILRNRDHKSKMLKADIYYSLAELSLKMDNLDDAKGYIKKIYPLIKDSDPKLIEYYYNLGKIYIEESASNKYAINNFSKAIELSESTKSPLLGKILFEIGNIYYHWKKYNLAIETLKKCMKIVEKQKNLKLEGRIHLLIGKILFFQGTFHDAHYYLNQAFEISNKKITDFKGCLIANNYLAKIAYFKNNPNEALKIFQRSFSLLRDIICRENIDVSEETQNKIAFSVILNIIKIKLELMNNDADSKFDTFSEILGYIEFLKYFQSRKFLPFNDSYNNSTPTSWNKKYNKLRDISRELLLLDNQLKETLNYKEREKILKDQGNKVDDYISTSDKIWNKSIDPILSFPKEPLDVIERFFDISAKIDQDWLILYIFYSVIDEKMICFQIDLKNKAINVGLKYITMENIKEIIEDIMDFNKLKKTSPSNAEINKKLKEFSKKIPDLIPEKTKSILIQNNYKTITFIPHRFLFNLPWELMEIDGDYLFSKFSITRHYSLDWLRIDMEKSIKNSSRKNAILFINNPDHGTDMSLENCDNEISVIKSKITKNCKYEELKYIDATKGNYIQFIENKKFSIFHFGGNLFLNLENPEKSRLKLFRHEYITPDEHLKYSFKIPPILILMNIKYENSKMNTGDEIFKILRSFMISGSTGQIFSISIPRNSNKSIFYTNLYKSICHNYSISQSISNSIINVDKKDSPLWEKCVIFIGNPHFSL
ncbi:MAG: tetratricopeptide repeat protein [Promethearchaeota archaeon]|nr:MAG: tetratricopeptide repeat protein [Candidatus Lokiarchaeota archaeon]